jgi:hypothetical protein
MKIRVQVIRVYEMDIDGVDTTDLNSINAACKAVERMQSTDIEAHSKLIDVTVQFAEAVGPSNDWMDWLDKAELMKRLSQDSK